MRMDWVSQHLQFSLDKEQGRLMTSYLWGATEKLFKKVKPARLQHAWIKIHLWKAGGSHCLVTSDSSIWLSTLFKYLYIVIESCLRSQNKPIQPLSPCRLEAEACPGTCTKCSVSGSATWPRNYLLSLFSMHLCYQCIPAKITFFCQRLIHWW